MNIFDEHFLLPKLKNLRNVAVPGTGVTLSLFCIAWVSSITGESEG